MRGRWAAAGFSVLVGTTAFTAERPVGGIEPAAPQWGTTLEIAYDAGSPGAKFRPGDAVHAVLWLWFPDRVETHALPLVGTGSDLVGELPVDDDLGYVDAFFVTAWGWDGEASVSTRIHRKDGRPARGAIQHGTSSGDEPDEYLEEIAFYPENYWAYRDRWWRLQSTKPPHWEGTIAEELARIGRIEREAPPDYLYAVSFAHLALGREEESRRVLKILGARFPNSDLTKRAFGDYAYQSDTQRLDPHGKEEISRLEGKIAAEHPSSPLARAAFRRLAPDAAFPRSALEAIFESWVADQPENPVPYLGMAVGLAARGTTRDRVARFLDRGIELSLLGRRRLFDDIGGKLAAEDLADAYRLRAELAAESGRVAEAIADLEAAKAFLEDSDGRPHLLEGRLWERVGQSTRAEKALREAWRRGTPGAEDALRDHFVRRNRVENEEAFQRFLRSNAEGLEPAAPVETAPEFSVVTMDGSVLGSASLRGSVVVLNFWFTGCGPCVREIPELNRLVERFRDRPVIFVAPALDDPEILGKFLRKRPFRYHVVPGSAALHSRLGIEHYPSHLILDREGRIAYRLHGTTDDVDAKLATVLTRLLDGVP